MKTLLALSLLLLSMQGFASDKGNGGDTTAQSFVSVMNKVYLFLEDNPRLAIKASRLEAKKNIKKLQESLGNISKQSLVEVTTKRPKDEFGVAKAAVTTIDPLKVILHKDSWDQPRNLNLEQVKKDQVTLAAMELLLLSGITTNRYQIASEQIGSRYEEVLATVANTNPGLPAYPENARPLKTNITGREYIVFDDAFVQALKNTTFKDCTFEIESMHNEESWAVNFYRPNGDVVYRITKGYEAVNGKRITWDNDKTIRMIHNARPFGKGITASTWDAPIEGVIAYTIVLNEDETEVKSIEFKSYLLKTVNNGTPLKPKNELVWEEMSKDNSCHQ